MRSSSLLLPLALFAHRVAASNVIYASAVSYCTTSSTARAIEVDTFLLTYDDDAKTISFDISAASVEPNLGAIVELNLDAYGIDAVNTSINLCEELAGVLCPLPVYDFVASATLPLPSGINVDLPAIAFKIPDLQATATVRLLRVTDGSEAVCLRVNLANGKSTRFAGIAWGVGGIALGAVLIGFLRGLVALIKGDIDSQLERGRAKERFIQIMLWLQFVASTGLLSLDYPLLFTSFTRNFAWCLGLIRIQSFQTEIDSMRNNTGGNLTQTAGTLVGGTRALESASRSAEISSLAANTNITTVSQGLMSSLYAAHKQSSHLVRQGAELVRRQAVDPAEAAVVAVPDVQEQDTVNEVMAGIPRWTTYLNIAPFNTFMTTFFNFLLLLCIFLAVLLLLAIPFFFIIRRLRKRREGKGINMSRGAFSSLVRANALRMLIISWFPLTLFTFFQWTLGASDSWAPIVISVFCFLLTTGSILFLLARTLFLVRRTNHENILGNGGGPYTPLWNAFKPSRWWFFLVIFFATFCRACFIAFARNHGWVQTVACLVIEVLLFVAMCVFTPFNDKSSNGMQITVQIARVAISIGLILLNSSITLGRIADSNVIPKVIVGAIIVVICAVVTAGMFILLLIDFVSLIIFAFRHRRNSASHKHHEQQLDGPMMQEQQYGAYGNQPLGAPQPHFGSELQNRSSLTLAEEEQRVEAARSKNVDMSGRQGGVSI